MYYLQSRYYDPEVGRFLNADGFISTGGLLGNNMFAYCGNNPLNYVDSTGYGPIDRVRELAVFMVLGACAAAMVPHPDTSKDLAEELDNVYQSAKAEVYEFAHSVKDSAAGVYEDHQPRVHHIVPWGEFSTRKTHGIVVEMQDILKEVGIDPVSHPLNLIVVSHGYHKTLHTDQYLTNLYTSLKSARGNRNAVEWVLYCARITIAFGDSYASGY